MKGKEPSNKYFDKMKPYLITLLYLAIFIALYLIMVVVIHKTTSFIMNSNEESSYGRLN